MSQTHFLLVIFKGYIKAVSGSRIESGIHSLGKLEADMKNSTSIGLALTLATGLFHGELLAGSAVIEGGSGKDTVRMSLEYRSGGLLRMQPEGQGQDGTMIMRDGKLYTVSNGMVIEMGSMMRQLGGAMAQSTPGSGPDDLNRFVSLKGTGKSETVAGVKGEVYELKYEDENGKLVTEEMVLSKDARAVEMRKAMEQMGQNMRVAMNRPETDGERKLMAAYGNFGVLRYGTDFRVVSLSDKNPAMSRFELPAEPTQMPNLGNLLGGGAGVEANANAEAGASSGGAFGALGGLFGKQTERQQQRVEQRVEGETNQATDEAVDSVLDKAMDKLFGR